MINRRQFLTTAALAPALAQERQPSPLVVKAKRKPADEWVEYPTQTVNTLRGFSPQSARPAVSRYGGRLDRRIAGSGAFRTLERDGRWWLVDPDGYLFLNVGVCSVTPGNSQRNRAALKEKFGAAERWAEAATALLHDNGFNGAGNWSSNDLLRGVPNPVSYTISGNFMGTFGRRLNIVQQQPGHMGYPNDAIPVFHPAFESFCDEYARGLADANDPYLLGYFSDNELPAPADLLDKSLALDPANEKTGPGAKAAREWLDRRKGAKALAADLNDEDRDAYREFVYERYFSLTTAALRKHDARHLCLGPRLYGVSLRSPGMIRAAGRHLDVIATNIYGQWSIAPEMLSMWRKEAPKPFLVTEFYAKGSDAGFPNTSGAGWVVPTQRDRGLFYQNFTLSGLESRQCVGWHWFKYMDNDPEDLSTDPSNRDSNKGMVTIAYAPYPALLKEMEVLNRNVYRVADYFDSRR
jgi:hypothetical protein